MYVFNLSMEITSSYNNDVMVVHFCISTGFIIHAIDLVKY